jgi:hypothetical protein
MSVCEAACEDDTTDADAICEAVQRPTMRFVPIKSGKQQAALTQTGPRDPLSNLVCITSFALTSSIGQSVRWPPSCCQERFRLVVYRRLLVGVGRV